MQTAADGEQEAFAQLSRQLKENAHQPVALTGIYAIEIWCWLRFRLSPPYSQFCPARNVHHPSRIWISLV
jgi:hypothetical protein